MYPFCIKEKIEEYDGKSDKTIKYKKGAKIIVKRFNNFSDDSLLQYINNIATDYGEV